jgi:serine/threonine protein kinase
MELLRGATLRRELRKETRLATPRTLAILRGVCAAIEAAHGRDLVHRDLKPENIFLTRSDSQEIAEVLAFGVAKFVHSSAQEATVDTDTGMLLGTLRYMSPEQLRGELATPAWDLWALAVVTYEMLTGGHPFAGESSIELLRAIVAGEAIPLAVHLPAAPTNWQRFFDRALACDAALRPRSPENFLVELQSAVA